MDVPFRRPECREEDSSIEGNFAAPESKVYTPMKSFILICGGLRWFGSWSLYWLGHLVSLPMRRWGHLYPIYNGLMPRSVSIQGDMEQGPWGKVCKTPPQD